MLLVGSVSCATSLARARHAPERAWGRHLHPEFGLPFIEVDLRAVGLKDAEGAHARLHVA